MGPDGQRGPRPARRGVVVLVASAVLAVAGCDVGGRGGADSTSAPDPSTGGSSAPSRSPAAPGSSPAPGASKAAPSAPSTPGPGDPVAATPLDDDGAPAPVPDSWTTSGVLASVDAARRASPDELGDAAVALLDTATEVVLPAWQDEVRAATADGPVTVADVRLSRDGVRARLAVLVPATDGEVVLRMLAASRAVGPAVDTLDVRASEAGASLPVAIEPDLDRVVVTLDGPRPDGVVLGLDVSYELPKPAELTDGGPGAYGLLADHGDVVALGHWLPAAVAVPDNAGDVPNWGDLGAFDAGTWLVDVMADGGVLRTGGVDRQWPDGRQRALGFGLRDLAAAWFPDGAEPVAVPVGDGLLADRVDDETSTSPAAVRGIGPSSVAPVRLQSSAVEVGASTVLATSVDGDDGRDVAELSAEQLAWLADTWGALPWPELDVVRAPILPAAGMEFPGMVMMDNTFWATNEVPTRFALAHEWGHQYAHALVGNGSLSDPVVDEPLAQYLTWRWFRHADGVAFADAFAEETFDDDIGVPLEPPGQPAAAFTTPEAYGVAIYRTAAAAWYEAAREHGVEVVDDAVGAVIEAGALKEFDEEELLDAVASVDGAVASDLRAAFDGG